MMSVDNVPVPPPLPGSALDRAIATLASWSDWLNPITVKEARQTLQARNFRGTLLLLVLGAWTISFFILPFVDFTSPGTRQHGAEFFMAYNFVLIIALIVLVPLSTMLSLNADRSNRSYELLEITNLTAWHVIAGKMQCMLVHVMVYLSALMPFLAFTYLLKGISLAEIFVTVAFEVATCITLSAIGLAAASLDVRGKIGGMPRFVFALALIPVFIFSCVGGVRLWQELLREQWGAQTMYVIFSALASTCAVALTIATAGLNFAASNRSSSVRVALLGQAAVCWTWVPLGMAHRYPKEFLSGCFWMFAIYWYLIGIFLTGESPVLSHRVRRNLPRSLPARTLLSWFAPGPGRGYLFVLSSYAAGVVAAIGLMLSHAWWTLDPSQTGTFVSKIWGDSFSWVILYATILGGYLAIYLGIGRLILHALTRGSRGSSLAQRVLVHALVALVLLITPEVIEVFQSRQWMHTYWLWSISNPVLTVGEKTRDFDDLMIVASFLSTATAAVLLLLRKSFRQELALGAERVPAHVLAEQREMTLLEEPLPSDPWADELKHPSA